MLKPTWVLIHWEIMQRLTARLLLLIALLGTFLPVALQATVTPQHACCRRQAAHHCHDSAETNPNEPVARSAGCCNGDCCRAVTSSQWAHPQPTLTAASVQNVTAGEISTQPDRPASTFQTFRSTRAPPTFLLA